MKKKKFNLELIRFVAMFSILIFHLNMRLLANDISYRMRFRYVGNLVTLGNFGVSLFIILSGVTSCLSFTSLLKKCNSPKQAVLEYYKKRVVSILLPFYVAYFLVHFTFRSVYLPYGGNFLWTLLGLDGYVAIDGIPTCYIVGEWFVGAILILYLVFPLLYLLVKKFPLPTALVTIVYYVLIIRFYPFSHAIDANVFTKVVDLIFGIYAGMYIKKYRTPAALAGLVILILNNRTHITFDWLLPHNFMYLVPIVGISAFIFLAWLGQLIQDWENILSRLFQKVVSAIAGFSYEIFLVHNVLITKYFATITNIGIGHKIYLSFFLIIFTEAFLLAICISGGVGVIKKAFPKKAD